MDFTTIFNQLTGNQQCLIINTMVEMEHCTLINEIDIANGIKHGRIMKGLSEKEMLKQLVPIYFEKKGYKTGNIEDDLKLVESTYKSITTRNTRNSDLYRSILKLLEINEDLITSAYFSNLSATKLFSSLSPRNQSAILYLMKNFETDYSLADDTKPIGVTPMDV